MSHLFRRRRSFNNLSIFVLLFLLLSLTSCSLFSSGGPALKNLTLMQAPKARLTYVAIGASETFGYGTSDPATQSWPVDLAHKLGSNVHLVNLGIPGIDTHDALDSEVPVAQDTHPDLITVWLAVNDLVDSVPVSDYQRDLDTLFSRLQSSTPHARILAANIPDLALLPRFRTSDPVALNKKITTYNTAIDLVVQRHHVKLVNLYARWQTLATHPEYISADGFHPSAAGSAQVAEIFYQTLQA